MNEDNLKKFIREEMETQRIEYERYMGVLSEDFKSGLGTIIDMARGTSDDVKSLKIQSDSIQEMVAKNTEDIVEMKADIVEIKTDIVVMKSDIKSIRSNTANHEERITALERVV